MPAPSPNQTLAISIQAVNHAVNGVVIQLFTPFSLERWFKLGFCNWLAIIHKIALHIMPVVYFFTMMLLGSVVKAKHPYQFNTPLNPNTVIESLSSWLMGNLLLFGVIFAVGIIAVISLHWLSAVGEFLFLDCLVNPRQPIFTHWRAFQRRGFSLFLWKILLYLCLAVLGVSMFIFGCGIIFSAAATGNIMTLPFLIAAGVMGLGLAFILFCSWSHMLLMDIMVPLMFKFNITGMIAFDYLLKMLKVYWGKFLAFWVVKSLLKIMIKMILMAALAITLFLPLLPNFIPGLNIGWHYLLTVILLPITVLLRLLGPALLTQLNPAYDIFSPLTDSETPLEPQSQSTSEAPQSQFYVPGHQ